MKNGDFDMSVHAGLVTVEEYLKLAPPKEGHYELHHGEVVLMPPPKWGHQEIQDRIQVLLKQLAGRRVRVRMEMAFRPLPEHELWVADIGYVSAERAQNVGEDQYLMGAPDLVVEVLSPSKTVHEINDKMSVCMENGCVSFWVVDPKRRMVSVTEGDVTKHYSLTAAISCEILNGSVPVAEIFSPQSEQK
jgi:Uma2 family endonuclease